ncbi:MAG TPA: LL-diaminopimelate aminotransferase [Clostridia bacterium]|nr:LL-diaminopimelate aminotransferase [Clostridia bacterium]
MISSKISERLGGTGFGKEEGTYKFAIIKDAKARAKKLHPDIPLIDMGVGEPDMPACKEIVDILYSEAGKAENRYYSDNGTLEFGEAASRYLKTAYRVSNIDPAANILHGIGSKPIFAMLPAAFINPGDITLATVPGYPIISTWTRYLGGEIYNLPLKEENSFYPDFTEIPEDILKRAKLLYINYPNNPTGQTATVDFYRQVVEFAARNNIIVVSDAAYAGLTYDGEKPLSFLSVEGAIDVGVEVHSLSKAFNMTGWRLAFIAGNSKIISAYGAVKDNTDSGQFRAIQKAGIYALDHPEITDKICEKYSRRFDMLIKALNELGFDAKKPKGSFYCYVKSPKGTAEGIEFKNAADTAKFFIEKALISVVPWDDAGSYLRISVTFEAASQVEEEMIIGEMKRRLKALNLVF